MIEVYLDGYRITKDVHQTPSWTIGSVADWTGVKMQPQEIACKRDLLTRWNVPQGARLLVEENGRQVAAFTVTGIKDNGHAGAAIQVQPYLAELFGKLALIEAIGSTPAACLASLLGSFANQTNLAGVAALQAAAGGVCNAYVAAMDSTKVMDVVARLLALGSGELMIGDDGLASWSIGQTWTPGYQLKLAGRLEQESFSLYEQTRSYSINHVYGGNVPATGGSGDPTWSDDFGPRSAVQAVGLAAAHYFGGTRLARAGKKRYSAPVRVEQFLSPGECYDADGVNVRLLSATFDGSGFASLQLEGFDG